jgi:hypothetical protein
LLAASLTSLNRGTYFSDGDLDLLQSNRANCGTILTP